MASHPYSPEVPIIRNTVIRRPRLISQLELAAQHPLTLVTGPPGYGKTTLAAQFARHTAHAVAWHTVEERERDVPNLIAHALSVLSYVAPNLQASAAKRDSATPSESVAEITQQLRTASLDVLFYILDDTQHLIGSPGAEAWLRSLVAQLPPTCHLILIGRALPN